MRSYKNASDIFLLSLLILFVAIAADFFRDFLPDYFIIFLLITYFFLGLGLLTNELIKRDQSNLLFTKIILLSIVLVIGYADFYFKLSRNCSNIFKGDIILSVVDSVYFSVTTFTTTGYGDISPVSNSAKMFVASEMIIGYIVSIFTMAMLVIKFIDPDSSPKN